jgi:hypothetical protein
VLTPPRWLAALSIAAGAVLFYDFLIGLVVQAGPAATGADEMPGGLLGVGLFFHAGYIVAPFWIGRGPWLSFFAGLVLAPTLVGWMLRFVPAALGDPVSGALGLIGLVAILGQYALILRHFWIDFQTSRTTSGPNADR